ncbi:MAG: PAS domain-containing protein [Lysobacteraceae bacterium]
MNTPLASDDLQAASALSDERSRHALLHLLEDQQRATSALQHSEQQLRFVTDHAPVLIAQLDSKQRYIFANQPYAEAFGYEVSDLIGKHVREVIGEVLYTANSARLASVLAGNAVEFEQPNLGILQGDRLAHVSYVPHRDVAGEVVGFLVAIVDITRRKHAESALRAREAQLSLIFDNIVDIVFLIDVSNDNTFHFAAVSRSFLLITGLCEDQVIGQLAENVLPVENHALVFGKYREAIQNRSTVYWEEVSEFPSGSRAGEITLTPIFAADGHCTQLIGTIHDVSALRAALKEIRQLNVELESRVVQRTEELQSANEELEAFSYSVSHDLRAPLRAITGFSEILATRHRDSLNEQGQRYLDNIVEASQHMGHLIDDLLNYARLGRSTIQLRELSLDDIVAPILVQLEARTAIIGAEIRVDPLPRVVGQPRLLTQVFNNLLDNAMAYCKPGIAPRIQLSSRPAGDHLVAILVSDNGVGIAPELHEKVFHVFQRLHSQESHPGTGIGLAIVRKSVELMGGSVSVTSEPGVGSTFAFTLQRDRDRTE